MHTWNLVPESPLFDHNDSASSATPSEATCSHNVPRTTVTICDFGQDGSPLLATQYGLFEETEDTRPRSRFLEHDIRTHLLHRSYFPGAAQFIIYRAVTSCTLRTTMATLTNNPMPTSFSTTHTHEINILDGNTNGATHANGDSNSSRTITTDVLIIGGGFGGMYGLHQIRQLGLNVTLFEAGSSFGGTWYWNRYPGARVDSETPFYSLSIPEVYKDWNFSERYPGHEELRRYFQHVDEVLKLGKDAHFNTIVVEA